MQKFNVPLEDRRGKHDNHAKISDNVRFEIRNFIRNLEARESHYSRERNEDKKFLPANTTQMSLYRSFLEQNPMFDPTNNDDDNVKYSLFCKIFNFEFNISFGFPRSDLCDTCELQNVRMNTARRENNQQAINEIEIQREQHWQEAEMFYELVRQSNQLENNYLALCADYEKNFVFPITGINKEYFMPHLNFYNFGIQNLHNNKATMIMYAQHYAKKGANEAATFLDFYLRDNCPPEAMHVKIFMDNSVGTNKNRFVFAMLQYLALTRFETIEAIFPIVGHSYMPIDRSFAIIEKSKKREDKIITPEDWTRVVRKARPAQPFQVVHVEHPLTNNLAPEEDTPLVRIIDYKRVFEPMLNNRLFLQRVRKVRFSRNLTPLMSESLLQECAAPIYLFRDGTTAQTIRDALVDPPLAYEDTMY